jgi:hypothetical protein
MLSVLSENEKRIQELCQELGECLYQQSQVKTFNNLGEIEETVRDLMIQYVNPEIGRVCRIKAEPLSDKLFSHFEHD